MKFLLALFLLLNATVAVAKTSNNVAILCKHVDGSEPEIYIIRAIKKDFIFFNQGTKQIEPICIGNCNWSYTTNRISFENRRNGFIISGKLNRAEGTLVLGLATGSYDKKVCSKTSMPSVTSNKF
jgi:hypothetical protein